MISGNKEVWDNFDAEQIAIGGTQATLPAINNTLLKA